MIACDRDGRDVAHDLPAVDGKFLRVDGRRFHVKGVSYGTFAPGPDGTQFPPADRVARDFADMARAGINTVRVYTVPSRELLDAALRAGLRVVVGIPWPQHVAFLDTPSLAREVRDAVVRSVARIADHPAVLLIALGNEIPPGVVRWHGRRRVEAFLHDLLRAARGVAPRALFTYVNYPPTEFLDLGPFDVCAFNVYLHRERDLRAYLARLQHVAGPRPLLLAEAGADSLRETEEAQARLTAMHLRAAFEEGCAGAIAFAWTDEWWRGGSAVEDWRFGLVDRERRPKPALAAVQSVFDAAPFPASERARWPRVSVVVCAYNAGGTISECLESLERLSYPDHEVIVVNDGSTDDTGARARRFEHVRVIDVPNGGLSAARNIGAREATGEIVAYTDADVRVDPDWLNYLVQPFLTSDVVASGGPNVVPADDPWLAQCVARAPGAPTHVLLDDRTAEHVPGCNMAVRREALLAIGGFNPLYVRAGDDVDVCWRLQARGWRIGFAPSALVWHRHRASVRAYWKQQVGYGEGEAWLAADHPEKFVGARMLWQGRIYSALPFVRRLTRTRLNTGRWGVAPFPSVYHATAQPLTRVPEGIAWQAIASTLAIAGLGLGASGHSPGAAGTMILVALGAWVLTGIRLLQYAGATTLPEGAVERAVGSTTRWRAAIALLHLAQPWARFHGRVRGWLHPRYRLRRSNGHVRARRASRDFVLALRALGGAAVEWRFWNERWHSHEDALHRLTAALRSARFSRDLEVDDGWRQDHDIAMPVGDWARVRVSALVEEHERGRVLVRVRLRLHLAWAALLVIAVWWTVAAASLAPVVTERRPWTATAIVAFVTTAFLLLGWRIAGAVASIRAATWKTMESLGAIALDGGEAFVRRPADVPIPAFAGRALLSLLLVSGPMLGGASIVRNSAAARLAARAQTAVERDARAAAPRALPVWRQPTLGLAVAPNGDIYLADASIDGIRRLTASGSTSTLQAAFPAAPSLRVSEVPAGRATSVAPARFSTPGGVAVGPSGDVFVADTRGHRVYRVDRVTGTTTTVAGRGDPGWSGDGGPATEARLHTPTAVAFDARGNLLIVDSGNDRIRRVSRKTHRIETIAGNSTRLAVGDVGDGRQAIEARLAWPSDLVVAPNGDIYIADTEHHRVRRIEAASGIITTVAGTGLDGPPGDGGPATSASLGAPTGLALVVRGKQRTLFVADAANGRVRVIAPDGTISSLPVPAGLTFRQPARLAYHPGGWLYVADWTTDRLTALELQGGRFTAVPLNAAPARATRPM